MTHEDRIARRLKRLIADAAKVGLVLVPDADAIGVRVMTREQEATVEDLRLVGRLVSFPTACGGGTTTSVFGTESAPRGSPEPRKAAPTLRTTISREELQRRRDMAYVGPVTCEADIEVREQYDKALVALDAGEDPSAFIERAGYLTFMMNR